VRHHTAKHPNAPLAQDPEVDPAMAEEGAALFRQRHPEYQASAASSTDSGAEEATAKPSSKKGKGRGKRTKMSESD
jgi:hypothetical protein